MKKVNHSNIIGYITITTRDTDPIPSHKVFVLVKDKKLPVGEFDIDDWDYSLPDGIDLLDIKQTRFLSSGLRRLMIAIKKVCPEEQWTSYIFTCFSRRKTLDIQDELENWFKKEFDNVIIVEVTKVSNIVKTKKIPITQKMIDHFVKHTQKFVKKNSRNEVKV